MMLRTREYSCRAGDHTLTIGAYNDIPPCGLDEWIGCDQGSYMAAICVCSHGCGMDDPCGATQTCVDGDCV